MSYELQSIEGNRQWLDGGAMFGNVPRPLWSRWIEPDERHRIELATRAFLVRDLFGGRNLLLEAGIGVFFDPKLRDRYGVVEPEHVLLDSLAARGLKPEDIDVVVLSHLHFDHAGGLLTPWREDGQYELVFPRARFLVGEQQWARARKPHQRDRASYVPELNKLLEDSGRLELVSGDGSLTLGEDFRFIFSDGHTPGLMLTMLETEEGSAFFCSDLIPGTPWVHLPVTMGYDRYPEKLVEEKEALLSRYAERGTHLLLTHDAKAATCKVARDETGRFSGVEPQETIEGLEL